MIVGLCLVATVTAQTVKKQKHTKAPPPPPPPYLNITMTPPNDLKAGASLEEAAKFAWQEFLALQWKASVDANHPPSATNQRGLPDPNWNYSSATPSFPNPLVWQTYAQTTELRPNGPLVTAWQDLGLPQYSYFNPPVAGSGSTPPVNNLWNNLDEDSEIGSCNIYGQYQNQSSPKELVLFQVKVNRDEYEYLRTNYGMQQNCAPASVIQQGRAQSYPNCTSSGGPLPSGGLLAQAQSAVTASINQSPYLYYAGQTSRCSCPPGQAICLPCGSNSANGAQGAIEVKTAWRRLKKGDDPSRFYTATALYYDVGPNNTLTYNNDTFALIGMHIIHKTENYPEFIFATFEQVDVETADMEYFLTAPVSVLPGTELRGPVLVKRQQGQSNKNEMHPVPATLTNVTQNVWTQLKSLNPNTVWQYYRLTGVQAGPIDVPVPLNGVPPTTANCLQQQDPVAATTKNPNYFMANFVIESDPFLNNFTGPGFGAGGGPIFKAGQSRGGTLTPTNGCENLVMQQSTTTSPSSSVQGVPQTIGGCQGCHGVAQSAFGTDFSFLLDFGNNKPSIMPAVIHYNAPGPVPPAAQTQTAVQSVGQARRAAFRNYMDGTQRKIQ
ncbi:MAG: hypothetical protein M3Q69_08370 [Acidobacteriota bacterium]|nr:hypothetical protein [Acidobacteriota bacterium]